MKKITVVMMIAWSCQLSAQLMDVVDSTKSNRFLGPEMSSCATETNHSKLNYQKSYDCGNGTISQLLNVNFLSPSLLGQQFYIFNNFMYWMGQNQSKKTGAPSQANPELYFSGSGVFSIVLGTSSYLQTIAAPAQSCPAGKNLLVGQLKYNDGNSIACWSQDSICLLPTDQFEIQISSDIDTAFAGTHHSSQVDTQGINWRKDSGPSANYTKANGSPRKIRFVLKNPVQKGLVSKPMS